MEFMGVYGSLWDQEFMESLYRWWLFYVDTPILCGCDYSECIRIFKGIRLFEYIRIFGVHENVLEWIRSCWEDGNVLDDYTY